MIHARPSASTGPQCGQPTRLVRLCLLTISLLVLLAACSRPNPVMTSEQAPPAPPIRQVALRAGDVLEFKFFYTPELNEVQSIRPDGRVHLQLVGDVDAAGRTPEELSTQLEQRYAGILKNPRIAVISRSLPGQRVYVAGEVNAPGPVDMPGPMTALEAVMFAGGFKSDTSEPASVIVIRDMGEGKRLGIGLDLKKAINGEAFDNFALAPRDIIFVPKSFIAQLDQWVDQYINKLIPQTGFSYSRQLSPTGAVNTTTIDLRKVQ